MNTRLNQLEKDLGRSEAADLLRFALPVIQDREARLKSLLLSGNRDEVAKCAHKALGSIGLYGSARLENLLKEASSIDTSGDEDLIAFQQSLSEEFEHVLSVIRVWLEKN